MRNIIYVPLALGFILAWLFIIVKMGPKGILWFLYPDAVLVKLGAASAIPILLIVAGAGGSVALEKLFDGVPAE